MSRTVQLILFLALAGGLSAAALPLTPYTVVARVDSFEHYRAGSSGSRFSLAAPYGSDDTVVATIVLPESLAGREIAIPFESKKGRKELLVQPGTIFRFEHISNLANLRSQTDRIYRSAIGFPEMGILVLKSNGEVGEAYEGSWTKRMTARAAKTGITPVQLPAAGTR
jgi:hypothetical protein